MAGLLRAGAALLGLILGGAAGPLWAVFLSIFAVVSVLPIVIAFARNHRNRAPITVLTLLLGWTFLGWAAALVWSFTLQHRGRPAARARRVRYVCWALWHKRHKPDDKDKLPTFQSSAFHATNPVV